jgi:hypothetical protein
MQQTVLILRKTSIRKQRGKHSGKNLGTVISRTFNVRWAEMKDKKKQKHCECKIKNGKLHKDKIKASNKATLTK